MMPWNRFTVVLLCACGIGSAVNIAITDTIDGQAISLSSEDDLETVLNHLRNLERISIYETPLDSTDGDVTEPPEESEENIGNAVLWYMTSSATILLLLLVSLLWCRCKANKEQTDEVTEVVVTAASTPVSETAPPAYDLFAPPSYESVRDNDNIDSWSVVWYIASFGGLITFFLVVSCSEWCCRKHVREQQARRTQQTTPSSPSPSSDVPPPAYDLFAPPSYESLSYPRDGDEKNEFDVYVVPVHSLTGLTNTTSEQQQPPSYSVVNETTTATASSPQINSASPS